MTGHSGFGMQCFLCCVVNYDSCDFLILLWDPVLALWLEVVGIPQLKASSFLSAWHMQQKQTSQGPVPWLHP